MQKSACIHVRRPEGFYRDLVRGYWIEIDGLRVTKLRRGEQVEIPVTPGPHSVKAVIDWTGSPSVHVEVAAGESARLAVQPAGNAFQLWQLFRQDSCLSLSTE